MGPNEVHTLRFIKRARTLGFSIEDIEKLLGLWKNRSRSSAAVKKLAQKHIDELRTRLAELQSMVHSLEHLARHCHGDQRPECPILEDLEKPRS
jgi:MerR family copper efflux transcriptional regulator